MKSAMEPSVKDQKVNILLNICEVHRTLYRKIIKNVKDPVIQKDLISTLEKAYRMGKTMNIKLHQYKNGYDHGWYVKNRDYNTLRKEMKNAERKEATANDD